MVRHLLQQHTSQKVDGYVDPNFPNPNGPNDVDIIIYGYHPSIILAVLGVVVFGLLSLITLLLIIRSKRRKAFAILVLVGTLMEVVGYVSRCLSSKVDPYRLNFFIIQYFFIVVAPVLFSAAIYVAFGRLLEVWREHVPVSPRTVLIIFLLIDIVTTLLQVAGASLIGSLESSNKDPKSGNDILLAGLAIQVASFAIFLALYLFVISRLPRDNKLLSAEEIPRMRAQWWAFLFLLVIASLVELRTCFRLAETAQGVGGYLSYHEVFFGCLEFTPVALAAAGLVLLQIRSFSSSATPSSVSH